jgi:hypothetical protein
MQTIKDGSIWTNQTVVVTGQARELDMLALIGHSP